MVWLLQGGRRVCHGAPATSAPVDHASRTGWGRTVRQPRRGRSCGGSSNDDREGFGPATLTTRRSPRRRQPHVDRRRRVRGHQRTVARRPLVPIEPRHLRRRVIDIDRNR